MFSAKNAVPLTRTSSYHPSQAENRPLIKVLPVPSQGAVDGLFDGTSSVSPILIHLLPLKKGRPNEIVSFRMFFSTADDTGFSGVAVTD